MNAVASAAAGPRDGEGGRSGRSAAAFLARPAAQGGSRGCSSSSAARSIATDHRGVPARREHDHQRAVQPDGRWRYAEPPAPVHVHAGHAGAAEAACARSIVVHAGAPGLPPPGHGRRPRPADGVLRARPQGRRVRARRRAGAARRPGEPEVHHAASSPTPAGAGAARRTASTTSALASRLSFFLWSSIPDDQLLDAGGARARCSARPCSTRRCAACWRDPQRRRPGATNFAGQWLHLRNLRSATPDKNEFPDFDDNLRQAFGTRAGAASSAASSAKTAACWT